jgi:hypothetical protein
MGGRVEPGHDGVCGEIVPAHTPDERRLPSVIGPH